MSTGSGQTIAAVERSLDVLDLFAGCETLGVTEIAKSLRLSKAVVYRILSSFRVKGYVTIDPDTRRYALGHKVLHLGLAYMDRLDIRALARPEMEALVRATDETATLSLRTGWTRVYVDQVLPDRDVKMVVTLGRAVPLHAGASSKAFLAFLGADEVTAYLAQGKLDRLTPLTITTEKALLKELAAVRQRGYSCSLGERMEGAGAVAAPVLGTEGRPVAVISVCGPVERFRDEIDDVAGHLLAATARLSGQLGYVRP